MSARSAEELLEELLEGILSHDLKKVKSVIDEGVDVNASEDHARLRPLHFAVQYDFLLAAKVLVSAGANIFAQNSDGDTALDIAILYKNEALIAYLKKEMKLIN